MSDEVKRLKEQLESVQKELEIRTWGLEKTNEAIKVLYDQLEVQNEELRNLDKLKSDFISTVSHELRTPMTTIREGVSQILEGILGETTEEQRDFLHMVLLDVDRLGRIINDLLDVSKIESGKMDFARDRVDIVGLIKEVRSLFQRQAQSKGLEIREDIPYDRLGIYIDRDKLIQVFSNLLSNAIKFTQIGHIDIAVRDMDSKVECCVADTGEGIAEEDMPKIFDKFRQFGKGGGPVQNGTGLGLTIVKGIIELHNGNIRVKSAPKKGASFIFTLPKHTPKEALREYVASRLREFLDDKTPLSLLMFEVKGLEQLDEKRSKAVTRDIDMMIANNLRDRADRAARKENDIFVALPMTKRESAVLAAKRMQNVLNEYIVKNGLDGSMTITYRSATAPEDAQTANALFGKVEGDMQK